MVQTKRAVWCTSDTSTDCGVDAVALEPGPVGREVLTDRADEDRSQPEATEAERDVRADPAAAHLQVVHEERQRHLVQLVGQQEFPEPTRKRHEVVGRD